MLEKLKENGETLFFSSIFLGLVSYLGMYDVPDSLHPPLINLLIIFGIRSACCIGVLQQTHLDGVKAVLIKILLPILVFCAVSKMTLSELSAMSHFGMMGFSHDLIVWILGGCITYTLYNLGFFSWPQALAVLFELGCLAPAATAYPFAPEIGPNALQSMVILDFGNKIWSLFVICFVIAVVVSEEGFNLKAIISKVLTIPMIWAFIFAIISMIIGFGPQHMRVAGKFLYKLKNITGPVTMIFIGMKLKLPSMDKLQIFLPLLYRRAISLALMVVLQMNYNFDTETFITMCCFSQAANSIWPYVHVNGMTDKDDKRVDKEFLFQLIAYDYTLAASFNMVLSNVEIGPGEGFMVCGALLGCAVALMGYIKMTKSSSDESMKSKKMA